MAGIFGVLHRAADDSLREPELSPIEAERYVFPNGHISIDCPPYYGRPSSVYVSADSKHAAVIYGELFLPDGNPLSVANFEHSFLKPFLHDKNSFLRTVEGGFGLAVMSARSCTIANDAFGTFPLHYVLNDQFFAFCTRMLPLRKFARNAALDERGTLEFLGLGHSLSGRTIFQDIHRLKRGTWISIGESIQTEEYIDRRFLPSMDVGPKLKSIHEDLSASVRQASTYEGAAAALSGGFDSRLTWSLLMQYGLQGRVTSHTHGVSNARDLQIARQITKHLRIQHDDIEYNDEVLRSFPNLWQDFITTTEGQLGLSHIHAYYSNKSLGQRHKVFIDSFGGASYRRQIKKYLERKIDANQDIVEQVLPFELSALARASLLREEVRRSIESAAREGLRSYYLGIENIPFVGDKFDLYYLDQTGSLRDCFSGAMQMHFIGLLQPQLRQKSLEVVSNLPLDVRRNEGVHRYIIHEAEPRLEQFWLDNGGLPAPYFGYQFGRLIAAGVERALRKSEEFIPLAHAVTLRKPPISPEQVLRPGFLIAREALLSRHPLYDYVIDRIQLERGLINFERTGQHAAELLQLLTYRLFLEMV